MAAADSDDRGGRSRNAATPLHPKLLSFDVFGTLISVREGSYAAFESVVRDAGGHGRVDVKAFWEHWEERNIAHYWEPYRRYRDICELSLAEAFEHYGLNGDPALISRYFDAFPTFRLYDDVVPTLDTLAKTYRLAVVSNIDDDLLGLPAGAGLRPRLHGRTCARLQARRHAVQVLDRARPHAVLR